MLRGLVLVVFVAACANESGSRPLTCDDLVLETGAACDPDRAGSCSVEGNPGCTTAPTSQICNCNEDGTFTCYCACYGGLTTCPVACPPTFQSAPTSQCATVGATCDYAEGQCTCTASGEMQQFACVSS